MQDKANMIPLQGIAQISTALEREDAQLDDSVLNVCLSYPLNLDG